MAKEIKNLQESVRARLENHAREQGQEFDFILLQYCQERFTYRLGASSFRDKFILKGGFYIISLHFPRERATRDLDFLVRDLSNNEDTLVAIITEICSIPCEDGVRFDTSSIRSERVLEDTEGYEGIRIKLLAYLGRAKETIQLDIAFGDRIPPVRDAIDLPVVLDMPSPHVRVYPLVSVISEKLETMVKLEDRNSRMNDLFDIYELSNLISFDGEILRRAIGQTFKARGRAIPDAIPTLLPQFYDKQDKRRLWDSFLKRNRVRREGLTLPEVARSIGAFVTPVVEAARSRKKFSFVWNPDERIWEG